MKTIVFRVNLETQNRQGWVQPNRIATDGNETVSEADNMKYGRTIYLPGSLNGNIQGIGPKNFFHHGDEFTAKGSDAMYLKKTYATGSPDDVLQVVSEN